LGSFAVAGGLLAGYAANVEPNWVEIVRLPLRLPRLPRALDGLTVAHITDLHAGYFVEADKIRLFVSMVNALHPDLIAITGDMFHERAREARMCAHELSALNAPLGTFVAMGNHERRQRPEIGEVPFRRVGLTVLANAATRIAVDGASLWMIGLDDLIWRRGDLTRALRGVPADACKILLVHEPDFADRASQYPIDLQLSGHTHGGQIRLPGIGPLLLPVLGRKYPMGLYRVRNTWVYTNRGLGVNRPPWRLNCRPEIALFTLRAANGDPGSDQPIPDGRTVPAGRAHSTTCAEE
jgi:predicted MPP superfamily phosphohydrolase